ncbi:hypothetical protein ELH72_08445 [Rhizobium ruizarguesonis]|jgi:hypothetical protein|uniref:hypothetical protein n=1 Tax=Rhizobium ruizarguesonis TaxID=2081791 RepID=UPI00102FB123|nr:hypothetical protein [Rhizobium ruizarguesonis]TAZ83288.1 hypothetical protein ELH72_08445 [Rhizobium ruizarguesonis]
MAAKSNLWSDRLSLAVFTMWISFYLLNILIILVYRMHILPGEAQILPSQVPICFFYATVVFLGPTFSMIFFYTSRKRAGDASIGMVSIIALTAISLVTNLAYTAYITYPMYHDLGPDDDIMTIFSEASTFAGYIIMILISPFISIVYSTNE